MDIISNTSTIKSASLVVAQSANEIKLGAINQKEVGDIRHRYWEWLKEWDRPAQSIGWCHTTDGWGFRDIMESGKILPQPCKVFQESLIYFFCGRPAYRIVNRDSIGLQARAPVTFIFSHQITNEGRRFFPFDSGAFYNELYKKWFHPNSTLHDFEMPVGCNAPEIHMAVFFESVKKYFACESMSPLIPIGGNFEAESIREMLNDKGTECSDDRRTAIELQVSKAISIRDERLIGIILPESLNDMDYFQDFLSGVPNKIIVKTYTVIAMKPASEYQLLLETFAQQIQLEGR